MIAIQLDAPAIRDYLGPVTANSVTGFDSLSEAAKSRKCNVWRLFSCPCVPYGRTGRESRKALPVPHRSVNPFGSAHPIDSGERFVTRTEAHTMTNIQVASVSPETLPILAHQGARVVTTDLLAQLYGVNSKHIADNYRNNATRFESGKHVYKLEGEELREFKQALTRNNRVSEAAAKNLPVSRNARHLLLWTERGAARHAKMLDTDQAWEVFERLEDAYFRPQSATAPYAANPGDVLTKDQADQLRGLLKDACERLPAEDRARFMIQGWSKLKTHFGVTYRQIPQAELVEATSIVARHIAEWTPSLPAPAKLTDEQRYILNVAIRASADRAAEPIHHNTGVAIREALKERFGTSIPPERFEEARRFIEQFDRQDDLHHLPEDQASEIIERLNRLANLFHPFSDQFSDVIGIGRALRGLSPKLGIRKAGYRQVLKPLNSQRQRLEGGKS